MPRTTPAFSLFPDPCAPAPPRARCARPDRHHGAGSARRGAVQTDEYISRVHHSAVNSERGGFPAAGGPPITQPRIAPCLTGLAHWTGTVEEKSGSLLFSLNSRTGNLARFKTKFKLIKPKTLGQALRIDGITPAAAYILLSHVKNGSKKLKRA